LQQALENTLPWFSAFRTRLRYGFFWHYLEHNPKTPRISEENDYPCRGIPLRQGDRYLFRVTYFSNRINLEVFHVVTDGAGAMQFLQALVCQYLLLATPDAFTERQRSHRWLSGHAQNTEDSYTENYVPTKKATFRNGRAYRLHGGNNLFGNMSVIHAHMDVEELRQYCRSKGVSITQYVTARIAYGIYRRQLQKHPSRYPLNIMMPINLRNMFDSTTSLNFYSSVYISLLMNEPELSFDDVLAEVKRQFAEKISREAMQEKISYTVGGGNHPFVRALPLPIKDLTLKIIFERSVHSSSLTFTNISELEVPEPFRPYVGGASVLLSTAPRERFKCAACSFGGVFTLSFSSIMHNVSLQREIVRGFANDGLEVTIESNGVDYESL
jgi:NRPS condensation-like uncharacterized protein